MYIYFSNLPLGRNIRSMRQKNYISCAKLARLSGMPYWALHLIERGLLHDIDHDHLKALTRILRTSEAELMGSL